MKKSLFGVMNSQGSHTDDGPILIYDREGFVGNGLVEKLQETLVDWPTVLVSEQKGVAAYRKNVVFVPIKKRVPSLPSAIYSLFFVFYEPEKNMDELFFEFSKKAKKDKARFILIALLQHANDPGLQRLCREYKTTALVLLGDVFGKQIPLDSPDTINRFFSQARQSGRVELEHSGMRKTTPVYFDDAINGLLKVAFGAPMGISSVFCLFPKHPPTELMLAHMLQKIEPLIRVDFIKGAIGTVHQEISFVQKERASYLLGERYALQKRIEESGLLSGIEKIQRNPLRKHTYSESKKKSRPAGPLFVFIAALFLLAMLFVPTVLSSVFGGVLLKEAGGALERGDTVSAGRLSRIARGSFIFARDAAVVSDSALSLIGQRDIGWYIGKKIDEGTSASLSVFYLSDATRTISSIIAGESKKPKDDMLQSLSQLRAATVLFQNISTQEKNDVASHGTMLIGGKSILPIKTERIDMLSGMLSRFVDVMPTVFGFDGPRSYLVLFQNNMELRPGGGFIGSYGVLSLTNGKIEKFTIHDVYDADGKLRGHIEPPFAIRRYLPSVHLYLRDSNFDVDFTKSASTSAFLLSQETGEKVDGVIAVDVSFVKMLLAVFGPVYVADYKETVTSGNLFPLAEQHAEKNFFPGSSQKKDFLQALFVAMQNSFSSKPIPYLSLLTAISDAASQKHVLFAFSDQATQNLFIANNMSSSLWDDRQATENGINDFLGVNEANIGVNKANFFIKRSISHEVSILDTGSINETATISYENNSSSWPGGDYKMYLRVILPNRSSVTGIAIDGQEQNIFPAITDPILYEAKNFKTPKGLEVENTEEDEKTMYGFLVVVPARGKKIVSVSYTLANQIMSDNPEFSYSLRLFKQPGTENDPYRLSLSYPDGFKLLNKNPLEIIKGNKLEFEENLIKDTDLFFHFSHK